MYNITKHNKFHGNRAILKTCVACITLICHTYATEHKPIGSKYPRKQCLIIHNNACCVFKWECACRRIWKRTYQERGSQVCTLSDFSIFVNIYISLTEVPFIRFRFLLKIHHFKEHYWKQQKFPKNIADVMCTYWIYYRNIREKSSK